MDPYCIQICHVTLGLLYKYPKRCQGSGACPLRHLWWPHFLTKKIKVYDTGQIIWKWNSSRKSGHGVVDSFNVLSDVEPCEKNGGRRGETSSWDHMVRKEKIQDWTPGLFCSKAPVLSHASSSGSFISEQVSGLACLYFLTRVFRGRERYEALSGSSPWLHLHLLRMYVGDSDAKEGNLPSDLQTPQMGSCIAADTKVICQQAKVK